ncbi:Na+/H+ antiporter subunit G [Litorisediminicola beolgyonensis]|uniref:Na+/H+ antiporter subunit G n=1 Tax=Litorisediminicola beolgyonensis TaxID=1173614 RepID=A0ABW3ZIL2_9RHOB
MIWLADILIGLSLLIGAAFTLIGSYGLVKLDQPMKRLHAPTKAGTLGIGSLLMASMVYAFAYGDGSLHEVLIMAFLFVTAPISAHFVSKVNLHHGTCEAPPPPPLDETWSTLDTGTQEQAAPKETRA